MLCTHTSLDVILLIIRLVVLFLVFISFFYLIFRFTKFLSRRGSLGKEITKPLIIFLSFLLTYSVITMDNIEDVGVWLPCKLQDGYVKEELCGSLSCILPNKDSGKQCSDSSECKGVCNLENAGYIKESFIKYYPLKYKKCDEMTGECPVSEGVDVSDWNKKIGLKLEGKCSKYTFSDNCPISIQEAGVRNDVLYVGCPWMRLPFNY